MFTTYVSGVSYPGKCAVSQPCVSIERQLLICLNWDWYRTIGRTLRWPSTPGREMQP